MVQLKRQNATATSALTAIRFTFLSTVPAIRSTHVHDDIVHCAEVTDLKKRLQRATYCLHTPKFEARLF